MHDPTISTLLADYEKGRLSRRQLVTYLTGLVAAAAAATTVAQAGRPVPTFAATDVNHIALRVTDIERSRAFYERHLGLTVTSCGESSCFLRCGERDFLAMFRSDTAGMDHYCFSVEGYTAGGAVKQLEAVGLAPRRRENRVYFDDPDGLEVQVAAKSHGP